MPTVIPIEDLRRSPTAALFEGGDAAPVSIFVTEYPRGRGPDPHRHPYPEVFVVETGTAIFTVGDEQTGVEAGNIVVVPGDTRHGFKNPADELLRVVSVHVSPAVVQTEA